MLDRDMMRARADGANREPVMSEAAGPESARITATARAIAEAESYFVARDGLQFAGTHLILDLWDASRLDDEDLVERTMRQASEAAGATLLRLDLHAFPSPGGITGVALLAESHISIHTWPERGYAAIDIFMCGRAEPHKAVEIIRNAFAPGAITLVEHKRGLMP